MALYAASALQAAEEAQYARMQRDINSAMHSQAASVEDFRRQQATRAAETLRRQAEEKAVRDRETAELYSNRIAPEFFTQFGTSHR
jgi:cell division septum initiation protein DivIVA